MKAIPVFFSAAMLLLGALPLRADGPAVTIVTDPKATEIERYAAAELTRLLESLFEARVALSPGAVPTDGAKVIHLGTTLLPEVGKALDISLEEQGHLVRSTPHGLVIHGGSPTATLWAVYEYGYANGMRYLVAGDFLPVEKPEFTLEGYDIVLKTASQPIRQWRVAGDTAAGLASWGFDDHQKLLRQLAKLKFNRVSLPEAGAWPEVEPIDVTGDIGGRAAFGGAREFRNPEEAVTGLSARIAEAAAALGLQSAGKDVADLPTIALGQADGGLLPQKAAVGPLAPGAGFSVQAHVVGDHNPELHYLSRAAFDPGLSADQALVELATPICGEGVAEALSLGFGAVAEASALIQKHDPGFAVPDSAMFMEHYRSADPAPAWWAEAKGLYAKGMNEMYRANTRARDGARPWILYHAKRYTFALHYFTAVESARAAGIARAAKDKAAWEEQLALAIEAMHNALGIYSEVAADQSDRGVIALLNEHGYRPLLEALDELP